MPGVCPYHGDSDGKYEGIQIDNPCPAWTKHFKVDPPEGEGWQLWETTTEGAPISPVFKTPEELAEWSEENATVFADIKAKKKEWLEAIQGGLIAAKCWNAIFI